MAGGDTHPLRPAGGFLGAPYSSDLSGAKAAVLGIPFDCGVSDTRIGARHGPAAIRQQSLTLGPHYPPFSSAHPTRELGLVDCGDAPVLPGRIEPSFAAIEAALRPIFEAGAVPLTFGGDGAVTLPQLRALKAVKGPLPVLHFDAHTDAYPPPKSGPDRHTTATTFTRAAEEGLVRVERSFHIGARGPSSVPDVLDYGRGQGYRIIDDREMRARGIANVLEEVRETLAGQGPVYLCWDMDFFDPAAAPGVCDPTWGGISAREGLDILQSLGDLEFAAFDINTVTPPLDPAGMTAHLAATVGLVMLHLLCKRNEAG
jgi:agmatinase